jgi:glycosyltransferase involved in cell wall biosynthesis
VIYYCVDDWSQFHNLDGAWLQKREEELLRRADIVFAASRFLVEKCRRVAGNRVIYMPHGVDHALFSRALSSETSEPEDLAGIPHPRIGFYGNLHPWVDFGLLESLVTAHPEWHFVLIGEIYCDVSRLRQLANVHFLGRREHKELPAYCKGFDVGIIPYDMKQARMASVNPIKTKEMLAAGVPVVAADVPELRGMGSAVCVCRTREEWDEAIRRQMKRLDRREISISVAGEDWGKKVQSIRIHVEGAYA